MGFKGVNIIWVCFRDEDLAATKRHKNRNSTLKTESIIKEDLQNEYRPERSVIQLLWRRRVTGYKIKPGDIK